MPEGPLPYYDEGMKLLLALGALAFGQLELRYPANEVFVLRTPRFLAGEGVPLTPAERKVSEDLFENSLDHDAVRIAFLHVKSDWAMTWGNVIRFSNSTYGMGLLAHELMHVYQFQHFGSGYISKSLNAYACAYVKTGKSAKARAYELVEGKSLFDYNVEQQAEIVEHWHRHESVRKDKRYQKLMAELRAKPKPLGLPLSVSIEQAAGVFANDKKPQDSRSFHGSSDWIPQLELRF